MGTVRQTIASRSQIKKRAASYILKGEEKMDENGMITHNWKGEPVRPHKPYVHSAVYKPKKAKREDVINKAVAKKLKVYQRWFYVFGLWSSNTGLYATTYVVRSNHILTNEEITDYLVKWDADLLCYFRNDREGLDGLMSSTDANTKEIQ